MSVASVVNDEFGLFRGVKIQTGKVKPRPAACNTCRIGSARMMPAHCLRQVGARTRVRILRALEIAGLKQGTAKEKAQRETAKPHSECAACTKTPFA